MFAREKKAQEFTISNETILRIIAFVVGTGLIINFFESIRHPLTLIFVAFFLSLALNPAVATVSKKLRIKNRTKATALSYVIVVTILIGFFALVFPPLIRQTAQFVNDVPETLQSLKEDEGAVGEAVRRYNLEEQISEIANQWASDSSGVTGQAVSTANRVISNLFSIITVLILTFMMLSEGPKWLGLFWKQYPKDKSAHAKKLATKMHGVVTDYVNGQFLVSAIGAFFATLAILIATTVFNVDGINAIALGGIVFIFCLIPTIGTIIATFLVVLFCLFSSVPLAITMLIYFVVYQQIENATVQPYIQSRANELTPLLVFTAAIIGIGFGGILGAVIAIPAAGCAKVLIDDYLEQRRIEDKPKKNP